LKSLVLLSVDGSDCYHRSLDIFVFVESQEFIFKLIALVPKNVGYPFEIVSILPPMSPPLIFVDYCSQHRLFIFLFWLQFICL